MTLFDIDKEVLGNAHPHGLAVAIPVFTSDLIDIQYACPNRSTSGHEPSNNTNMSFVNLLKLYAQENDASDSDTH